MASPTPDSGNTETPLAFRLAARSLMIGTLLALGGAALYGANIPAARVASQAGLPGADLIFYRALILIPALALLARFTGTSLSLAPGQRAPMFRLALFAALTATFYLTAIDHLPVPLAVTLFYTFPLVVMLASAALEGRRLRGIQIGVFAIAFAGLILAVGPSFANMSGAGIIFALLAACAAAAMFLVAGRVSAGPIRGMFWTQMVMGPVSLVMALIHGGPAPLSVFPKAPVAIALAMGAYALAYGLQLAAAQRVSPSRMSLLYLFEPVTAVIVAGAFLNETLAPLQLLGLGLILAALATEILADRPRG